MKEIFSVRLFSRSGIIICFVILIVNVATFFNMSPEERNQFNYYYIRPSMCYALVTSVGTFLMTLLIMFHKHKMVVAVSVITFIALTWLKFIFSV